MVGVVLFALMIPVILHWHYPILILSWNASVSIFFLPGQPSLWMLMSGISFALAVLACILNRENRLQSDPFVTGSLLFLALVVLVTAKLTGGIGLRAMGANIYGGKKFYFIVAALLGYFAISFQRIPPDKVQRYAGFFILAGMTSVLPNIVYSAGPRFFFLFLFFPVDFALNQAMEDFQVVATEVRFSRLTGVTYGCLALLSYLLMRYGVRGVLDVRKPWRISVALVCLALSTLGGFRSVLVIVALLVIIQFFLEGLFRTRLFLTVMLAGVLSLVVLVPVVRQLPLSVQRSLSVVPFLDIDPAARADAQASIEWRVGMWQVLIPQIEQYFWLGKGYAINPQDLYLAEQAVRWGLAQDYEMSLVSGDYHSGPLSILIPFGIFGLIAWLLFWAASLRLLYRNYLYGDPALKSINTFLLAYYLARMVFYVFGHGSFHSDVAFFVGLTAFGLAINGDQKAERALSPGAGLVYTAPGIPAPKPL